MLTVLNLSGELLNGFRNLAERVASDQDASHVLSTLAVKHWENWMDKFEASPELSGIEIGEISRGDERLTAVVGFDGHAGELALVPYELMITYTDNLPIELVTHFVSCIQDGLLRASGNA